MAGVHNLTTCTVFQNILSVSENILLLNYAHADQASVTKTLAQYPTLRDFHNEPPFIGPFLQMANFVAHAVNATLFSVRNLRDGCKVKALRSFPTFHIQYITEGKALSDKISRGSYSFNFAYCDQIRKDIQNISPLEIFKETATPTVWTCLALSLLSISFFVKAATHKGSYFSTFVITLSALLCSGVSGLSKSVGRKSWLLTMWLCTSVIFATFYSGKITSTVISPAKEFRLTRITQLGNKNYSMLASTGRLSSSGPAILKSIIQGLSPGEVVQALQIVMHAYSVEPDEERFFERMVTLDKYVFVSSWQKCIYIVNQAEDYIIRRNIIGRHCYIGQELLFPQVMFFAVTPRNTEVARAIGIMMETGFYAIWWKELRGIVASNRVQSRIVMVSPTKLKEAKGPPKRLAISHGRLRNVFALWATCLVACNIIFFMETLSSFYDNYIGKLIYLLVVYKFSINY